MFIDVDRCLVAARRVLGAGTTSVRKCRDTCQLYTQVRAANPNTSEQQAIRDAGKLIAATWRALTPEHHEQWKAAARKLTPEFGRSLGQLTGYMLFCHCARNCLNVGAPLPESLPGLLCLRGPGEVVLLPAGDPSAFHFTIKHDIDAAACASYRVLTQMTPPTARSCRAPEARNGRLICGFGPASAPPLPRSGQTLEFTGARYAVAPGQRFGVWMRMVHLPDGLSSEDVFLDLVRD
jgi:hypothetical protein